MALFDKQNFSPSVFSKQWIAMQFRPNMLVYSQANVAIILQSGLLFREDSLDIEQEVHFWMDGRFANPWLTTGEKVASVLALGVVYTMLPFRGFNRGLMGRMSAYLAAPMALRSVNRWRSSGSMHALLSIMGDYLTVARRSAACCREYATLYSKLESVATEVESMQRLLFSQQEDMTMMLSRVASAILGNVPWIKGDIAWEVVVRPGDSLMKIHHTFLVVQSLMLKYIAMAHYMARNLRKHYKNHNERIYWLHNVVMKYLITEYRENYEALDRMYRLLKNCGTLDSRAETKKPGSAITDRWLYSEVHTEVAKSCLELKIALSKCNNIDVFLDSCATNNYDVDLNTLNNDIDTLIDDITRCLDTAQSSQIRLKKLQGKIKAKELSNAEEEDVIEEDNIVFINDEVPEAKDEVFYCVKTEDDDWIPQAHDLTTGPGAKEKETSKVVLSELKRKLGKREDVMRERERQALKKTMPQYRHNVPEFPRQIKLEDFVERKGFLKKIAVKIPKKKLFRNYKISHPRKKELFNKVFMKDTKYKVLVTTYSDVDDVIADEMFEANTALEGKKPVLLTLYRRKHLIIVRKWHKYNGEFLVETSDILSYDGSIDSRLNYESSILDRMMMEDQNKEQNNYVCRREDLDITPTSSDEELRGRLALLDDARRRREDRNNYVSRNFNEADESMRPIEYSFGTGMAMASVLQGNGGKLPAMVQEEVYVGDGEVSDDSGNNDEN